MAGSGRHNNGTTARIVGVLNRITVALIFAGVGLILAGLVTIPLLGYTAATVSAVGTWSLSLGGFTACLWLLAAALHRATNGRWYWGESPRRAFSRRGWLLVVIAAVSTVILVIVLD
jgi:hypothetical protein